jgi:cell wall assembly regulator SMI1
MSIDVSLTRLRELALAIPRPGCDWEERPRFDPPATSESLAELERVAGFVLPDDLRAFFAQTDAVVGMSVHNGYWIGGTKQLVQSTERGDFPRAISGGLVVPIATDGGGNAFLLGENRRVWLWDHESDKVKMVADSFEAFLEQVAGDWAAYVSDNRDWQFLV